MPVLPDPQSVLVARAPDTSVEALQWTQVQRLRRVLAIATFLTLCCVAAARADVPWPDSHDQCEICHSEHFSQSHSWSGVGTVSTTPQLNGDWLGTTGPNRMLLKTGTSNDELCISCHEQPPAVPTPARRRTASLSTTSRTFTGIASWNRSAHSQVPANLGASNGNGKCANCHNPHGVADANGLIPARLRSREQPVCLGCHDNLQRGDIASQLLRTYVHGALAPGTHDPEEGDDPAQFGTTPRNQRHVACSDCHNSHEAFEDPAPPQAPRASSRLAGVSRIKVMNGSAGTTPVYLWQAADEPGPINEYEVCFKCHSSWTTQPQGQADLALLTNPANASSHPIQERGRNPGIDPAAFVNGFAADSLVRCTDCHRSDDERTAGPHGSANAHLLKSPATTSTLPETPRRDNLCFDCHAFATYADPAAPEAALRASRFNGPATTGHAVHVGVHQVPCYSCHETHGSVLHPALIVTGRGIQSYLQTSAGGACTTSCHAMQTYSGNYPR